jgi:hypothetical protein
MSDTQNHYNDESLQKDSQNMLKEVYVISHGILLFHYDRVRARTDSDQAIISSGLMSAMTDFSKEMRSDVLQSFSTESEYFLFQPCKDVERFVVGVFDRRAPERLAKETLTRVKMLVDATKVSPIPGIQIERLERDRLREEIDEITAQMFGSDELPSHIEELLGGRTDIPLAFVIDTDEKKPIAHFARPHALFKDNQIKELLLVHDTVCTTLAKLGFGDQYSRFALQSSEYAVAACWTGKLLTLAAGALRTPSKNVAEAAAQMCYQSLVIVLPQSETLRLTSRSVLLDNGKIVRITGEPLPQIANVFLSTLSNNLDAFFRILNRRSFRRFEVDGRGGDRKRLVLTKDESGKVTDVEVYELLSAATNSN